MADPIERLVALQARDLPVHGGRTLAYVYDSGDPEIDRVAREAVATYAASNALDPTAFPSLLQMENELVGFACRLLDAPDGAVGTVTSGGTESILLAVQGARDARPDVVRPRMVLPATAHWRPPARCRRRSPQPWRRDRPGSRARPARGPPRRRSSARP